MDGNDSQKITLNKKELSKLAFSVLEVSQKEENGKQFDNQVSDISDLVDSKIKDLKKNNDVKIENKSQIKHGITSLIVQEDKETIDADKVEAALQSITPETIKKNINNKQDDLKYEELLESYIGYNYDKINNRFFNISAFIFGPFYCLYRKMYITGFTSILILTLMLNFISSTRVLLSSILIYMIVLGIIFNPLYSKVSKNKIKKLNDKYKGENIKEKCILYGGTNILNPTLITTGYALILILFFASQTFNVFSKIVNISYGNNQGVDVNIKAEKFKDMIESYTLTAKLNIDNPGLYKYLIDEEEYDFIALPVASNNKNIYCTKKSKEENWQNNKGFKVKENSTSCDEFMTDILINYFKFYNIELPDKGQIILSNDGKIENNTKLVFGNLSCKYESKVEKFKCR